MSSNLLGELVANNGTYFLPAGSSYTGRVDQIIVRGSTINDCQIKINQKDVTEDYLGGLRLPDGLRITPKGDDVFTYVKCISSDTPHEGFELVLSA